MSVISSTTGHNSKSERRVARILYICVGIAILLFAIVMLMPQSGSDAQPASESTPPPPQTSSQNSDEVSP